MVELRILGPLKLSASDGQDVEAVARQSKRAALLAYLATAVPRGLHRRDRLLTLFWPESDQAHARAALNQAIYVLRTALGDQAVVTQGNDEVGLDLEQVWCDVAAFEAALDAGDVTAALGLYRGDLLDGFFVAEAPEFEHWLDRERERLRQRASEGAWALASAMAASDAIGAARWARRAAELLPADEVVIRRLMSFLQKLGDRAAAVRAYEAYAWQLARDYELEPSTETQGLAAEIRQEAQHPSLEASHATRAPAAPTLPAREPSTRRRRVIRPLFVGVALAAALGAAIIRPWRGHGATTAAPRILVLPFQNLGAPQDAYFADGITDELTARLATVKALRVVAGQTALHYRGTDKTPRQIGAEASVDYVLAGTVSWEHAPGSPGRVRIRPQLIDVRDETQRWAAVLDENMDMTRLFALLSGITERVVDELHVALEPPQRRRFGDAPTKSLEAFDYYVRARTFARGAWLASNNRAAIALLEQAVARDSTFALAYALLAQAHTDAHWLHSMGAQHLGLAKQAAERAFRLDSNLPEVHMALGHYYYACCQDYPRALYHLTMSHAASPSDAQVEMYIGNVHKRLGEWDDAVRSYEEAASLDPAWKSPLLNLSQVQLWLRSYEDAERTSRRVLVLEPREAFAYTLWASVPLLRDGDVSASRRLVREAAAVSDGYDGMRLPYYLDLLERKYGVAVTRLTDKLGPLESGDDWLVSDEVRKAVAFRLLGDSVAARAHFDAARRQLESDLRGDLAQSPQRRNWLASGLAISYAGLGRTAEAADLARRVVAWDPVAVDAIGGPAALQDVALTYAMVGDRRAALNIIERLLSIPARFSPQLLRLDPLWDPLRGDPMFERLARRQ